MEHAQMKSMAMSVNVIQDLMEQTARIVSFMKMQLKWFVVQLFDIKMLMNTVIHVSRLRDISKNSSNAFNVEPL